jgi:hypothetical protein
MLKITKQLGVLGIVIATAIVGLVLAQGAVFGADTQVTLVDDASATAPTIMCKWELPDMDSFAPGMQYEGAEGVHDDSPAGPSTSPACVQMPPPTQVGGYGDWGTYVGDMGGYDVPSAVHNMIQVEPNVETYMDGEMGMDGDPGTRTIELWGVVGHPQGPIGIGDVYWQVFHPDGVQKVQVHGIPVPQTPKDPGRPCPYLGMGAYEEQKCAYWQPDYHCSMLGRSNTDDSMFEAANETGQVAWDAIDDTTHGFAHMCLQDKVIYYAQFELDKHQPCGQYKVVMVASSADGSQKNILLNYFDVPCVIYLEADFEIIDWGELRAGSMKPKAGDFTFSWGDGFPTVHNGGNAGMETFIWFSEMYSPDNPGKPIDLFDAYLTKDPLEAFDSPDVPANSWHWFGDTPNQVLCSNEIAKLHTSIHVPAGWGAGVYTGEVDLRGQLNETCVCTRLGDPVGGDQRAQCLDATGP